MIVNVVCGGDCCCDGGCNGGCWFLGGGNCHCAFIYLLVLDKYIILTYSKYYFNI